MYNFTQDIYSTFPTELENISPNFPCPEEIILFYSYRKLSVWRSVNDKIGY